MYTITAYRGVTLGPAATFDATVPYGSEYAWAAAPAFRERTGRAPVYDLTTPQPIVTQIQIRPGATAGGDSDAWRRSALALFSPYDGLDTLQIAAAGTTLETQALIRVIQHHPQVSMRPEVEGVLLAELIRPDPLWRSTTVQTDTASPTTAGGNAPAAPKVTFRPTTGTVLARRIDVTEASGRGIVNHPFMITVDTTGAGVTTAQHLALIHRGQALPLTATGYGTSTTEIWFPLTLLPSETSPLYVLYGSALANTVTAQQYEPAGFDWGDAGWTNVNWIYRNTAGTFEGQYAAAIWETARAPQRPGAWTRVEFGGRSDDSLWTEGASQIALSGRAGIQLVTQIPAIASNALKGLQATSWNNAYVQYRRTGEWSWRQGSATYAGIPAMLSAIDVPSAVAVVLWSNQGSVTYTQKDTTTPIPIRVELAAADVPTYIVNTAETWQRLNGTLTNSTTGDTIEFDEVFFKDDAAGGFVVDTNAAAGERLRVYPTAAGSPWFTLSGGRGWRLSNRKGWPLVVGANDWAWTGDGAPTITIAHQDAFAL